MAGGFSVTISAVDQATKTIDAINARMKAMSAPVERLNASLTKLSRLSGLSDLARGMQSLARSAFGVFRNISQIIAPLGAITGAASLAGMYRLVSSWGLWAQHQQIAAQRIGISAGKLQEFEGVARLAGSSTDAMDSGITTLRDNLYNLTHNMAGADTVQAFKALGLNADFVASHVNDVGGALPTILDKLRAIPDPTLRAAAAQQVFGSAAADLAPVINLTRDKFEEYTKQVQAHGEVTDQQVDKLREFTRAQASVEMSVNSLGIAIGAAVSGPLTDLLNGISRWIDANRDLIASKADEYAHRFADWVKSVDWSAVGAGVLSFATEAGHLATELEHALQWMDRMGLVGPALGVVLGAKLLAPLVGIGKALGAIGAFNPPAWALAALGVAGYIAEKNRADVIGQATGGDPSAIVSGQTGEYIPNPTGPVPQGGITGFIDHLYGRIFGSKSAGAPVYPGQGTQGTGNERNLRNNNPTNLSFAGQPGATSDGRFAKFPNLETGVAADLNQFLLYQKRDHLTSIADMIHKATPGSDNPGVEDYINRVATAMHMGRDDSPDLTDPSVARRFILAVAPNEGGTPDADAVQRGVNLRLGVTPPTPAGAPAVAPPTAMGSPISISPPADRDRTDVAGPTGKVSITLDHRNAPQGSTLTAQASGDAIAGPVNIQTSMPMAGATPRGDM